MESSELKRGRGIGGEGESLPLPPGPDSGQAEAKTEKDGVGEPSCRAGRQDVALPIATNSDVEDQW